MKRRLVKLLREQREDWYWTDSAGERKFDPGRLFNWCMCLLVCALMLAMGALMAYAIVVFVVLNMSLLAWATVLGAIVGLVAFVQVGALVQEWWWDRGEEPRIPSTDLRVARLDETGEWPPHSDSTPVRTAPARADIDEALDRIRRRAGEQV
jgi:O-antigen ligase